MWEEVVSPPPYSLQDLLAGRAAPAGGMEKVQSVSDYRNRGHKRATLLGLAAKAPGVTFRRAKALIYGEPVSVYQPELDAIRAIFLDRLEEEAETLNKRTQDIRARQRAMNPALIPHTPRRRHDDIGLQFLIPWPPCPQERPCRHHPGNVVAS
jgi:hypothetical protein